MGRVAQWWEALWRQKQTPPPSPVSYSGPRFDTFVASTMRAHQSKLRENLFDTFVASTMRAHQSKLRENLLGHNALFYTLGRKTGVTPTQLVVGRRTWEACEYCDGRVREEATDCHRCGAPLPAKTRIR